MKKDLINKYLEGSEVNEDMGILSQLLTAGGIAAITAGGYYAVKFGLHLLNVGKEKVINHVFADVIADRKTKEAIEWLEGQQFFVELKEKIDELEQVGLDVKKMKTNKMHRKLESPKKDAELEKVVKQFKMVDAERMEIKRKLARALKSSGLNDNQKQAVFSLVPGMDQMKVE
jgi:hypothetical protein